MSAQTPQKFTLEEISLRKKKLLNEIHAQKKAMTATTREIFAPIAPANNGVMLGVKVMRKVRTYFRNLR